MVSSIQMLVNYRRRCAVPDDNVYLLKSRQRIWCHPCYRVWMCSEGPSNIYIDKVKKTNGNNVTSSEIERQWGLPCRFYGSQHQGPSTISASWRDITSCQSCLWPLREESYHNLMAWHWTRSTLIQMVNHLTHTIFIILICDGLNVSGLSCWFTTCFAVFIQSTWRRLSIWKWRCDVASIL